MGCVPSRPPGLGARRSYRAFGDAVGVLNAYGAFAVAPKGGGAPRTQFDRTTFVYARRGRRASTPPGGVHGKCGFFAATSAVRRLQRLDRTSRPAQPGRRRWLARRLLSHSGMADTDGVLASLETALREAVQDVRRAIKLQAYEGFGRDRWQRPADVVERLAIRPGDVVADLGAGGGYFTFRLAAATGPAGRVHAVETDKDMVAHLRERVARERVPNVQVVEASETDAHLPAGGVDLIFTCDAHHHLADRIGYFARLRSSLRRGGRLVVIDHDGTTGIVARWFGHATPPTVMADELGAAGYRVVETWDGLPGQTFVVLSAA